MRLAFGEYIRRAEEQCLGPPGSRTERDAGSWAVESGVRVIGAQASDQETSVQEATHADADKQRDHAEWHQANQESQLDLFLVGRHTEFRRDHVDESPEPSVVADRKHDQDDDKSSEDGEWR